MIDYLVLAPLTLECDALVAQLERAGATVMRDVERDEYRATVDDGRGNAVRAVVKLLTRAGRVSAAITAQEAIVRLEPRMVLVVGIAGGVEVVTALGDVLVADQIVDASQRKATEGRERIHSQVYRTSQRLLAVARNLDRTWVDRVATLPPGGGVVTPRVHVGIVVSTDTLVSSADYIAPLQDSFRGLLGVEMESGGVAAAIEASSSAIEFLVIRCVVDHMNGAKSDWRAHGAQIAAAYAVALMQAAYRPAQTATTAPQVTSPRVAPSLPEPGTNRPGPATEPAITPSAPPAITLSAPPAITLSAPPADPPPPPRVSRDSATDADDTAVEWTSGTATNVAREAGGAKPSLRADEYAGALSDVLANASGEICFALLGHWGRGKTFLARRVEEKLTRRVKNKPPPIYDAVWFSAWKYRSRPELWAHLYESFYRAMMRGEWWRRVPRVFRANLDKHGIGPLLLMFIGAGIAAIPLGSVFRLAVATLGIVGAIRGAMLYFKQRTPVANTLNRFFYVNRHSEKLGFQAAIGDDLKSLVIGWVGRLGWSWPRNLIAVIGYSASVALFMLCLWWGFHGKPIDLPYLRSLSWYPSTPRLEMALYLIVGVTVALPCWLLFTGRGQRRLLLIVDDLDRMPASEMLEVVESLKLFLEHDQVRELVQIVMICEEESLRTALTEKYGGARRPSAEHGPPGFPDPRVVEENLQKLFVAHVRLPPLGLDEQREVLTDFIGRVTERLTSSEHSAPPVDIVAGQSQPAPVPAPARSPSPAPVPLQPLPHPVASPAVEYTDDDRRALALGLTILAADGSAWASLGPRAIQSYALRYKLARRLLEARNAPVTPRRLAAALAARLHDGAPPPGALPSSTTALDQVVAEVV